MSITEEENEQINEFYEQLILFCRKYAKELYGAFNESEELRKNEIIPLPYSKGCGVTFELAGHSTYVSVLTELNSRRDPENITYELLVKSNRCTRRYNTINDVIEDLIDINNQLLKGDFNFY